MRNPELAEKIKMALQVSLTCKGAMMLTSTADLFHPLYPHPITIPEIAHTLSQVCRYGGHCPRHYSVAQHAILCSYLGDPAYAFHKLHHDSHEYSFGDWPKPVKNAIPQLVPLERGVEMQVRSAIDVPLDDPRDVWLADQKALEIEMWGLWADEMPIGVEEKAAWVLVKDLSMTEARDMFLARHEELCGEVD